MTTIAIIGAILTIFMAGSFVYVRRVAYRRSARKLDAANAAASLYDLRRDARLTLRRGD